MCVRVCECVRACMRVCGYGCVCVCVYVSEYVRTCCIVWQHCIMKRNVILSSLCRGLHYCEVLCMDIGWHYCLCIGCIIEIGLRLFFLRNFIFESV